MVQDKQMEAGDLFSFIMYTGILGGAIASFGTLYTQIAGAVGATERILEIMEITPEVSIENSQKDTQLPLIGDIIYKNVGFSYPSRPDLTVLKDINIHIQSGQKIALVGQSGSGKSTIAQLLMKFYDIQQGEITVDGRNIKEFEVTAFRKNISIVPQDVILFGGTIRENISYGKPEASDDEILNAARQSNCWEFISSFPEGLDTIVGERGIKLSGGQRQRIAIARAILKDPKILILDEATSSLDAESEKLVQEALDILMANRTSIIIAHRLSTIKDVDCIYVLDQGVIKETGTHEELLSKENGLFASLAKLHYELEV
jgi:ATP-binding cassette subfamily B protein